MRFSLRSLFVLFIIISLALALWLERHNSASTLERYQIQVNGHRASVLDCTTGEEFAPDSSRITSFVD
jgi:hypothetical protein